ncbi:hypothetical protein NUW54_g12561 [Trametes sanguinea]|uniref:Uncharacterized protein n=1 Tax=Trametes sanguinea TaxID=158606 RepID=A0ACC1MXR5_9APHY|nr:hypothetical protein NUW54_g12561 [Trametes sanguinea]
MVGTSLPPGTAPIKPEFLVSVKPRDVPDDDAAEGTTSHVNGRPDAMPGAEGVEEGAKKLSGAQRKKLAKEERKKHRGANKGRRFQKVRDEVELCFRIASGKDCEFGDEYVSLLLSSRCGTTEPSRCRFTHDVAAYLAAKPRDIHLPSPEDLSDKPPFVRLPDVEMAEAADAPQTSLDPRWPRRRSRTVLGILVSETN